MAIIKWTLADENGSAIQNRPLKFRGFGGFSVVGASASPQAA
jgi:hypothetical protein